LIGIELVGKNNYPIIMEVKMLHLFNSIIQMSICYT